MSTTPILPDFNELDALLTQEVPSAVAVEQTTEPPAEEVDPFDELDGMIKEAVESQREAKAAKALKDRAKRGGTLLAEDLQRLREWEARHEWREVANASLWIQHQCQCGTVLNIFEGLFTKREHRHLPGTFDYQRAMSSKLDLPNLTILQVKSTPMCNDCAAVKGWNTDEPDVIWDEYKFYADPQEAVKALEEAAEDGPVADDDAEGDA